MPPYSVPDGRKWLYGKGRDALLSARDDTLAKNSGFYNGHGCFHSRRKWQDNKRLRRLYSRQHAAKSLQDMILNAQVLE